MGLNALRGYSRSQDRIVVEYSEDRELSASTLARALEKEGVSIEMKKIRGRGLLLFKLNNLIFREEEYPYLVARIIEKEKY